MDNGDVAALFFEMADLLDIEGGDRYRIRAFRRIARVLESLAEPLPELLKYGRLAKLPGVGYGGVSRIKDILATGTTGELERLRGQLPTGLRELSKVEGIGPRTVRLLWSELRIGSVPELERAAKTGRLAALPGLGEKTEEKILRGIEVYRRQVGRVSLARALDLGGAIIDRLRDDAAVVAIELAGSARRRKETVQDLDVLVASDDDEAIVRRFVALPDVDEVMMSGHSKASVRLASGQQVDLHVSPPESWGAALHYFTGSQQHNIALRARGNRRGVKISDKGAFRRSDDARLAFCEREEDVFAAVGLPFIPPELRENTGEIEAADEGRLPRLVAAEELIGDLRAHTNEGEGSRSAKEMVEAARALGLRYVAITDRAAALGGGVADYLARLKALKKATRGITVIAGIEVDVLPDGSLDLDLARLRDFDWVVAAAHAHLDQSGPEMTRRLVRAMETGVVDLVAHPTNRIIGIRNAIELDLEKLLRAARRHDVALEVNANPNRLDLDPIACRRARELGVPVVVSSDARNPGELARRRFGVHVARRGWLEASSVLNTRPWKLLAERRRARLARGPLRDVAGDAPIAPPEAPPVSIVDALAAKLAKGRVDDELRERLEHFFATGSDDALEEALKKIAPNPIQKAFELLNGGGAS